MFLSKRHRRGGEIIAFIDKIIAEEIIQLNSVSMACLPNLVCIP